MCRPILLLKWVKQHDLYPKGIRTMSSDAFFILLLHISYSNCAIVYLSIFYFFLSFV